jgi:hypothetical protein
MQRSNSGYGNRSHDVKHTSNNQDWRREFITLASLLIVTRVLDGLITYAITPDLSRETNPLVSIFGLGWAGPIIDDRHSAWHRDLAELSEPQQSLRQFSAHLSRL